MTALTTAAPDPTGAVLQVVAAVTVLFGVVISAGLTVTYLINHKERT